MCQRMPWLCPLGRMEEESEKGGGDAELPLLISPFILSVQHPTAQDSWIHVSNSCQSMLSIPSISTFNSVRNQTMDVGHDASVQNR